MSIFDRLIGRKKVPAQPRQSAPQQQPQYQPRPQSHPPQYGRQYSNRPPGHRRPARPPMKSPAEQALDRYHYMLRTAPVATIERAFADAFIKLTPQQRHIVLQQLAASVPPNERAGVEGTPDDPASLAHLATQIEVRSPGTMERIFSSMSATPPPGPNKGTFSSNNFMNTFTWLFLGGMVAQQYFDTSMYGGFDNLGPGGYDHGDYGGADFGGDPGGGDLGGGDFGGGDFGGGDFGGGDLGGIF